LKLLVLLHEHNQSFHLYPISGLKQQLYTNLLKYQVVMKPTEVRIFGCWGLPCGAARNYLSGLPDRFS